MRITINAIIFLCLITVSVFALADLSNNVLVPKLESSFAKDYLQKIQDKDFEFVKSQLDSSLTGQVTDQDLLKIANYFPSGHLLSTELVGSHVNTVNSTWEGNFTFEYHFEQGWALANVVLKRVNNKLTVIGFNVYRTKASQKEINKFSLIGNSPIQYLILTSAILVPLFILISLIVCIKTPIVKRKWLWILFILGGIGTISVNWTTGAYGLKILQYQLFGLAVSGANEYAPLVLTIGFPIGAVAFWFKRRQMKNIVIV
jgi:hypothetical protein